jgi:hypothetical protein
MSIKKQILLSVTVYSFLGYLIATHINSSLPFPFWAIILYFIIATVIFMGVFTERDWRLRGLVILGILGYVGMCILIGILLI